MEMRLRDIMKNKWVKFILFFLIFIFCFIMFNINKTILFIKSIVYNNPSSNTILDKYQFIIDVQSEMCIAINQYYYFHKKIPYGEIDGNNNLWILTTPTIYYSNILYSITPDPFKQGNLESIRYWGQDMNKSKYIGGCIDYYSEGSMIYIIRSYGPNRKPDLNDLEINKLLYKYDQSIIELKTYDPTNGILSNGDYIFWREVPKIEYQNNQSQIE